MNFYRNGGEKNFMRKFIVLITFAMIFSGCTLLGLQQSNDDAGVGMVEKDEETAMMMEDNFSEDKMIKKIDEEMMEEMMEMGYQYRGELLDVTGGEVVGGINTGGVGGGLARASFEEGAYSLLATFGNLPNPKGTDFYEGWVVRKSPLSVISTGRVEVVKGALTNLYSSGQNLRDHDFYVLTIEPNDGDSAPAGHVLEGTMKRTDI